MITIKTKTFNLFELVNTISKKFLCKHSPVNKIKIEVKFYDVNENLIEPSFYFITKNFKSEDKLYNYVRNSYIKFLKNNNNLRNKNVKKYEINIIKL